MLYQRRRSIVRHHLKGDVWQLGQLDEVFQLPVPQELDAAVELDRLTAA